MLPTSLPKRYVRLILASLVAFGFLYSINEQSLSTSSRQNPDPLEGVPFPKVQQAADGTGLPPLYDTYRRYEDELSERHLSNANGTGRYIFFANHAEGCGWGNVLQEMVFGSLLASESNLGYVWDDYTWNADGSKYSDFKGSPIPSRIPLSTMISGHLLGLGPTKDSPTASPPQSISRRVYERICPTGERVLISRNLAKEHLASLNAPISLDQGSGLEILNGWLSMLETPAFKAARCIEVVKDSPHVFDIWFFGSTERVHNLWDRLSQSPTIRRWGWSPLILRAFEKNVHLFVPEKGLAVPPSSFSGFFGGLWSFFGNSKRLPYPPPTSQLKGQVFKAIDSATSTSTKALLDPRIFSDSEPLPILALHLRRGDFKEHCSNIAEWGLLYTGVNSFPQFRVRDAFNPPQITSPDDDNALEMTEHVNAEEDRLPVVTSMAEKKQVYARHCFPDIDEIVRRVREVVHEYVNVMLTKERERKQRNAWWMWRSFAKEAREIGDSLAENNLAATADGSADSSVLDARAMLVRGNKLPAIATRSGLPKKVFIMTNGDREWLAAVKLALLDDVARSKALMGNSNATGSEWAFEWEWEDVVTTRDLEIGWEEHPVAHMLDSYVSQRAELFIGNGFSSLTSNIVMLRMQKGLHSIQTRFW